MQITQVQTNLIGIKVANNKLYADQFPWLVVETAINQDGKLILHCILTEGNTRGDTATFAFTDCQVNPAFLSNQVNFTYNADLDLIERST